MIQGSWKALVWIGLSELCALSLWFSASVIAPDLIEIWNLSSNSEAWLSAAIPIIQRIIGWEWAFTILAIGPIFGIGFMVKYRRYESTNEKVQL